MAYFKPITNTRTLGKGPSPGTLHSVSCFFLFLDFRDVDFFGNTPLELAIQLKSNSSTIKLLGEVEEVSHV